MSNHRSINFWNAFASHPPALIRLLARTRRGKTVVAITAEEIAIISGLTLSRVTEISLQTNWADVSLAEVERFCLGCGFDPTSSQHRNREKAYAKTCQQPRPRFLWIRRSPRFASEFLPLIVALKKSPLASLLTSPTSASPKAS
jgi:hypothetical protein